MLDSTGAPLIVALPWSSSEKVRRSVNSGVSGQSKPSGFIAISRCRPIFVSEAIFRSCTGALVQFAARHPQISVGSLVATHGEAKLLWNADQCVQTV